MIATNKFSCWNCVHAQTCWMFRLFQETVSKTNGNFVINRNEDNKHYGNGKSEIHDIYDTIGGSCLEYKSSGVVKQLNK
jgi:hypothetical protein